MPGRPGCVPASASGLRRLLLPAFPGLQLGLPGSSSLCLAAWLLACPRQSPGSAERALPFGCVSALPVPRSLPVCGRLPSTQGTTQPLLAGYLARPSDRGEGLPWRPLPRLSLPHPEPGDLQDWKHPEVLGLAPLRSKPRRARVSLTALLVAPSPRQLLEGTFMRPLQS